jgi:hypothetical protein
MMDATETPTNITNITNITNTTNTTNMNITHENKTATPGAQS